VMPTNVLASFVSALADGGSVCWDTTPVRVRLAPKWAHTFQRQPDDVRGELREVLRRAAAFHQQVQDSAGTHVIPYLVLPGAPPSSLESCISCGVPIASGWRCPVCLVAVYIALGKLHALAEIVNETTGGQTAGEP
jgi:hypothetical protein